MPGGNHDEHAAAAGALLRFGRPDTVRRRLICLPFAGGGPATYRLWPRCLPDDVEVLAAQLPGREVPRRGEPLDRVDQIVPVLIEAIRGATELPYAIFGHSLGVPRARAHGGARTGR